MNGSSYKFIPVYESLFFGNEKKYLNECIDSGWVSSDGIFEKKFEDEFAQWWENKYAIAVNSGTAALQTAVYAMHIKGIMSVPVGTIVSCLIAAYRNAIFVNLYDNHVVADNLMRCHLFGQLNDSIGINVIDDCSQYWQPFKTSGAACYSLYANKIITCGEGGIITTNDVEVAVRSRHYRNLCHSTERFVHTDFGANFRMSNLQAAVALAQLEQIDDIIALKRQNRDLYKKYMPKGIKILFNVEVPWMYLIKTKVDAGDAVAFMKKENIDCRRFFFPLNRQPFIFYPQLHITNQFPYSEDMWKYAFYLPSGLTLTVKDIQRICRSLESMLDIMT